MSFNEIEIKQFYTPPKDDVINDFFLPTLKRAISYNRAVAFFSSKALYEMTIGISGLVENGGRIKYIISPENLSQEDIDAIHEGYIGRDKILSKVMAPLFENDSNPFVKDRLTLLSYLIENSYMDIQIAIPKNVRKPGIFHDKFGIIEDDIGNKIAFYGSYNDTEPAIHSNNERIGTYSTMHGDYDGVNTLANDFDLLWRNNYEYDEVFPFPEDIKATLAKFRSSHVNFDVDKDEFSTKKSPTHIPEAPKSVIFRNYQEQAVKHWVENGYRGIFDMATGAGKTWTAMLGVTKLLTDKKCFIIICCPYQHLVDQWCSDLDDWNFEYITGYSGSPTKKWKTRLNDAVLDFNRNVYNYRCFITTNASFATDYVQKQIYNIRGDKLLIVDEAHNFGATRLRNMLTDFYEYRLGLSATIDRYNDEVGTNALLNFFGEKCVSYSLQNAIDDGKLTHYYYYPIAVSLQPQEMERYSELSEKIRQETRYDENKHEYYSTKYGDQLRIERARIIAGAANKLSTLKNLLSRERNNNHILVYCGATTANDYGYSERNDDNEDIRQIDAVTQIIGLELEMSVHRFTSSENAEERRNLIKLFDEGKQLQVLAAIKCLDEGVSIKSIEKAYILASSTNPREYIQRRGRVLRLYPGKDYAYIYDFVTLPRPLETVTDTKDLEDDYSLLRRELVRVKDFAKSAENSSDSDKLIDKIEDVYGSLKNPSGEQND